MAANETSPIMTTSQVITNAAGPPTLTEPAPVAPQTAGPAAQPVTYPPTAGPVNPNTAAEIQPGVGIEGEEVVWEARYAMKNFLGRIVVRSILTIAWLALLTYTWGYSDGSLDVLTWLTGIAVAVLWATLIYRVILARFGHYYRLTTRRLFVSTGVWRRRRDMMELLRVKDVYTRQTLVERWLSLGSVIVEPDERDIPTFYLTGVDDPKRVMDLVWHHARAERDLRSVKVEQV